MFSQKIIKALANMTKKSKPPKVLYTYSGYYFNPNKNKDGYKKPPPKSIHEYQAYH